MRVRTAVVAASVGVLVIGAWVVLGVNRTRRSGGTEDEPAERARRAAVILARAQKARVKRPPRFDLQQELSLRGMADQAVNAKEEVMKGDARWLPTVVQMDDLHWLADKRRQCGRTFGTEIRTACNYQIDMVIERTNGVEGKVAYARSQVVDPEPEPLCDAFAECIAEARLDESLPIPPGAERRLSISQKLQSTPMGDMANAKELAQAIEETKAGIAELRKTVDPRNAAELMRLMEQENLVKYTETRLTELMVTGK